MITRLKMARTMKMSSGKTLGIVENVRIPSDHIHQPVQWGPVFCLRLWIGGEIRDVEHWDWFEETVGSFQSLSLTKLDFGSPFWIASPDEGPEAVSIGAVATALRANGLQTALKRDQHFPIEDRLGPIDPLTAAPPVLVYLRLQGLAS